MRRRAGSERCTARSPTGRSRVGGVPKALHDGIAGAVYAAVRGGASLAGLAADAALSRREVRALSATPRGAAALAVINGLRGDALGARGQPAGGADDRARR